MRIAPRPRDHARDPRAPVRSCWHVTQARTRTTRPGPKCENRKSGPTEAVLYLLTPPYTQSRCASTITVYCRACPHATDTNHAYGLCCMHYVCITFRVPCSGVGATSGPCGVWPRIRQRLTSCIFARVRDAPPERQGQRDEPSSALRLQKVLRRLALPTKPLASRSMHLTEQSMQRILQQLPWHPPLSPTFQAQPSPRLPWIPSTTRGRS